METLFSATPAASNTSTWTLGSLKNGEKHMTAANTIRTLKAPSVFFYRKEDWSTEEDPSRPTYHWGGKPPPTYAENLASMVEKVTTGFFRCHVCGCEIRGPNRAISHAYKHATGKIRDARREKNATLHTAQGPGDEPCFQTSSGSDPKSFGK